MILLTYSFSQGRVAVAAAQNRAVHLNRRVDRNPEASQSLEAAVHPKLQHLIKNFKIVNCAFRLSIRIR